jgi:hypothetical protein
MHGRLCVSPEIMRIDLNRTYIFRVFNEQSIFMTSSIQVIKDKTRYSPFSFFSKVFYGRISWIIFPIPYVISFFCDLY